MNVKKAIKKIAAVAFGAAMIGSTVLGAADLADYPENVMSNGAFDGKIVIGLAAKPQDVIAAIDIATNLQAESVSAASVACEGSAATTMYSIDNGIQIKDEYSSLNFGEKFNNVFAKLKDDDLNILADGTLEDDDGSEYDYEQTIEFSGNIDTAFGRNSGNDIFGDEPEPYLEFLGSSTNPDYVLTVKFLDAVNVSALDDSEEIEMFGKEFTFDSAIANTGDITLYTSTVTETLSVGDVKTVPVDGEDTEIQVLGGNTDASTALVKVDGTTKEVEEGRSYSFSGKDIRIKSIFTTTIPEETVAVEIEVGSDALVIDTDGSWNQVTDDDNNDFEGLYAKVSGTNQALDKIQFGIVASDLENEAEDDFKYLLEGMEFVTPVFDTVAISFEGVSPALDSSARDEVAFEVSGENVKLSFTNEDGDSFSEDLFEGVSGTANIKLNLDYALNESNLTEDDYFFLNEEDGDVNTTILYQIDNIKDDGDNDYVEITEVVSGQKITIYQDDVADSDSEIGDTGVSVIGINASMNNITLDGNTTTTFYTKDDVKIHIGTAAELVAAKTAAGSASMTVTITEDAYGDITDDLADSAAASFAIDLTSDASDTDAEIGTPTSVTNMDEASEDSGDVKYGLGGAGLYYEKDTDNNEWIKIYSSPSELEYVAFVATDGAKVSSVSAGADGSSVSSVKVNPISVGVAISDEDAMSLIGKENLIVVGGPSVNTVAAKLKGNPTREEILAEYKMGVGLVELYDSAMASDLGNTLALLVGGYDYADTQRAARAVALHDDDNFKGDAIEVHGTSTTISEIKAVEE